MVLAVVLSCEAKIRCSQSFISKLSKLLEKMELVKQ